MDFVQGYNNFFAESLDEFLEYESSSFGEALNESCPTSFTYWLNYLSYEAPLYSPNAIGEFYHDIPRVTYSNFTEFEYTTDEEDYWLGVIVAASFTFVFGVTTFVTILIHISFSLLNDWVYSLKGTSHWAYATFGPYVDEKMALEQAKEEERRLSQIKTLESEGVVRHERETLRHLFICGQPLSREHNITIGVTIFSVLVVVASILCCLLGFVAAYYGYIGTLDDAESLKDTFNEIGDKLVEIENEFLTLDEDTYQLAVDCPLWNATNSLVHKRLMGLVDDIDSLADIFYLIADYIEAGEDVAVEYEDGTFYAIPFVLLTDIVLFSVIILVIAHKKWLRTQSREHQVLLPNSRVEYITAIYDFLMTFGAAPPKLVKAGILMISWVALGLLIVGTIAGSDYCDEADDNTVNFSYKWAKDFGTSEKTAVLVRELVRYYAYCPKLEYGSQQNTTFVLLSILGEEVPNTISEVTSMYGEIRRQDEFEDWVNCSSANLTIFSSMVDKCCLVTKLDDRIKEVVEDVCDVLILADCPTINEVYHDLIGDSMCDGVFTEGLGMLAIGLLLFNLALMLVTPIYGQQIRYHRKSSQIFDDINLPDLPVETKESSTGFGTFGTPKQQTIEHDGGGNDQSS